LSLSFLIASRESSWTAAALVHRADVLDASVTCGDVNRMFTSDPGGPPAFAVRAKSGLGLIDRGTCMSVFAQRFGRELFERRPVSAIMDAEPLIVSAMLDVGAVSAMVADRKPDALRTGFIVVGEDDEYRGVATGLDLMRLAAEYLQETVISLQLMQTALIENEKLAALGGLVAGIAHEINTPVGVTMVAASQLDESTAAIREAFATGTMRRDDLDRYLETTRETVTLISANARRAGELVQSFKQVAVDQVGDERRPFDLAEYLHEIVLSLRPQLKRSQVSVGVDCPERIVVDGYPGALAQAVSNLIANALMHAYDHGVPGTIHIAARSLPGDRVELRVTDDGRGIAPELLERIFDPFFTTKRGRGGSGLGLSIVHNIVHRVLGGMIAVASPPGGGTTFTMEFPRASPYRSDARFAPYQTERTAS
jgi:signal transduction histidine kinase